MEQQLKPLMEQLALLGEAGATPGGIPVSPKNVGKSMQIQQKMDYQFGGLDLELTME